MAEDQSGGGEKEFEATEQRLRQARQEGDVPQSKEANSFALFAGILVAAIVMRVVVGDALFNDLSAMLYHGDAYSKDIFEAEGASTRTWLIGAILKFAPLLLVVAVSILLALVVQQSIAFSMKKIAFDMKKISPASNIGKRYGPKGLLDFAKDFAKFLFAGLIALIFLFQFARSYYGSSALQEGRFAEFTFTQIFNLILCFCIFQGALAAIDLPLQKQLHARRLRMTREEMKKEIKQNEGDPQLKQMRREKASKISKREMMQNVKTSTVVMVNPEHYAVALKWDPDGERAPVCVAKGVDHMAARIREVALENDVPIYRDPPCARSLYRLVDIDEEIHPEHFAAVAAAIQFVNRVRQEMNGENG